MVEKPVLDEPKGLSFGLLQESIQDLTEDSLTSQTKLRNLTSLLESIDGRVRVIEERVVAQQKVQQQVTDNSTATELQLLRRSLERANESSFQQLLDLNATVSQLQQQVKDVVFRTESSSRQLQDLNATVSQLQQEAIDVKSKGETLHADGKANHPDTTVSQLQQQVKDVQSKVNHSERVTVTFDDLVSQSSSSPIENGYKGITWTNVHYVDPVGCGWFFGYRSGVVSCPNIVFNNVGERATIAPFDGSNKISFFGFFATAAFIDGMSLFVKGYKNGNVVATKTVTLRTTSPTKIDFDSTFHGLDKFTFVGNRGSNVVLDDITLAVIKT